TLSVMFSLTSSQPEKTPAFAGVFETVIALLGFGLLAGRANRRCRRRALRFLRDLLLLHLSVRRFRRARSRGLLHLLALRAGRTGAGARLCIGSAGQCDGSD